MLLERYEYEIGKSYKQYDFYSEGPNGRIRKIVFYSHFGRSDGIDYYNLGFGDYDEQKMKMNDLSISNNNDREKILSTVAMTAIDFTDHYPGCRIVFQGSTGARTRLYQMGIAKYFKEMSQEFDVQGLTEKEGWESSFRIGVNYLGFLAQRKNVNLLYGVGL